MEAEVNAWKKELQIILDDFNKLALLRKGDILVVGCSTSEVIGKRIGTAGTSAVAEMIFGEFFKMGLESGVNLAFQCCEHLNRALVMEREVADAKGFEEVSVIPVQSAGGAMATFAYQQFNQPVVVEAIKADAGIDIGDTFIGMHLKHVAVPLRSEQKTVGSAHVTMARTRPKLIGGERAVYSDKKANKSC